MAAAIEYTERNLLDPKSSAGIYNLPIGYLDDSGEVLSEIVVRELSGIEEDILASKTTPGDVKINQILSNCTSRLGTVTNRDALNAMVSELPAGDRIYLLFCIRRETLGDELWFDSTCEKEVNGQKCGHTSAKRVLISELKVAEPKDRKLREFPLDLPSGRKAVLRFLTGTAESQANEITKKTPDLAPTASIFVRLVSLDGKEPTVEIVQKMAYKDRLRLRQFFQKEEPGLETTVQVLCEKCKQESDLEVSPAAEGFFFPSAR